MAENSPPAADPTLKSFRGLKNTVSPERFEAGDLAIATNVDLDDTGRLARRDGFTLLRTGAAHSLAQLTEDTAIFAAADGAGREGLYRLLPDGSAVLLQGGFSPAPWAYVDPGIGRLYASNGSETCVIDAGAARSWGLTPPAHPGSAQAGSGELPPGRYQYTLTYVRTDGQQSGAPMAAALDVTAGGIDWTDLPVSNDPTVSHKALYLTPANGDQLYLALVIDNAATTAHYGQSGIALQELLTTQFLTPAPAGHLLGAWRGFLFVAVGNLLFYSQPYGYELFDPRDYLPFDSRITLIAPVDDGLFVATETRTWWMTGETPRAFRLETEVAPYGALPGSAARVRPELLADGLAGGAAVLWLSADGAVCLGRNQGQFANLTGARYRFTDLPRSGAGLFRPDTRQYLVALRD